MSYEPPNGTLTFYGDLGAADKFVLFSPKTPAKTLWNTKPGSRPDTALSKVDPQLFLLAQAAGAQPKKVLFSFLGGIPQPGWGTWNLEYRATIRGALAALKKAGVPGYAKVNLTKLKSEYMFQSNAEDKALYSLVGGKDLKDGAAKATKIVKKHGLEQAAFAYRGLYIAENTEEGTAAKVAMIAGPIVLDLFAPGAGRAVALGLGVKKAVVTGYAKKVTGSLATDAAAGLAAAAPAVAKTVAANPMAVNFTPEQAAATDLQYLQSGPFGLAPSYFGIPTTPLLIGGAVASIGLIMAVAASRSNN